MGAGPTLAVQQRRAPISKVTLLRVLTGFLVRPNMQTLVLCSRMTRPVCTPNYSIPAPALGSHFFRSLVVPYRGPVYSNGEEACKHEA
jgi:hypothetical protein